jgi:hypothetical protein
MLLMERAGPVTETQRKCLEEAEKATTRVLGVVERLEILARWDQRPSQAKNAAVVALDALVRESTSALPIEMALDVRSDYGDEHVFGDGRHIRLLIDSVIRCVRSSIDGPVAVSVAASPVGETSERWVVVCAPDQLASAFDSNNLEPFPHDRVPLLHALDIAVGTRLVTAHGGHLMGLRGAAPGAVIALRRAPDDSTFEPSA